MTNFITKLQEKPYETRVRILWATVLGAASILLIIFVFSLKNTLRGVEGKSLLELNPVSQKTLAETQIAYASVERVERTDKALKIYFNFNNPTNEILNISKLSDISLNFEGGSLAPDKITDRQGNPFVQKILSHTQNFGILFFPTTNAAKANLVFNQMYQEKDPSNIFQQKLDLNIEELIQSTKVRN